MSFVLEFFLNLRAWRKKPMVMKAAVPFSLGHSLIQPTINRRVFRLSSPLIPIPHTRTHTPRPFFQPTIDTQGKVVVTAGQSQGHMRQHGGRLYCLLERSRGHYRFTPDDASTAAAKIGRRRRSDQRPPGSVRSRSPWPQIPDR